MNKLPEQANACKTCRYYAQHYSRCKTKYIAVNCGHCMNPNIKNTKPKRPDDHSCELWEDIAVQKAERKQTIQQSLLSMSQRLDELTILFKDDTDN